MLTRNPSRYLAGVQRAIAAPGKPHPPSTDLPDELIFRIRVKRRYQKYFSLSEIQIALCFVPSRALLRGAYRDRHGRWLRDAMDVQALPDEQGQCGRRNRAVPIPRRWNQASRGTFAGGDGGQRARRTEEITYKP
jgi:hypothetical protein